MNILRCSVLLQLNFPARLLYLRWISETMNLILVCGLSKTRRFSIYQDPPRGQITHGKSQLYQNLFDIYTRVTIWDFIKIFYLHEVICKPPVNSPSLLLISWCKTNVLTLSNFSKHKGPPRIFSTDGSYLETLFTVRTGFRSSISTCWSSNDPSIPPKYSTEPE